MNCFTCARGLTGFIPLFLVVAILTSQVASYYSGRNDVHRVYARVGQNASLPCVPAAEVGTVSRLEWWKEDQKIVETVSGRTILWKAERHVSLHPSTYALNFRAVSNKDNGEYQCIVNYQRTKDGFVGLLVQDSPDPPGIPLVMGFTSRSVNLSWAPSLDNRNSPILHYIIHIREGENGEWDVDNAIVTKDNKTSYHVVGLKPYNLYAFRVLAVNAIGPSLPSKESYMVTPWEAPGDKPTIISAHNASSSSIRLQWTPPPRDTLHGEFLGYHITFRPRDRPDEEKEIIVRDPDVRQYTIRNLKTFTQYKITVQVFNPAGMGPAATVAVMTDEDTPSSPHNLTVLRITDSTVKLRWHEPLNPNGIILGYHVYFLNADRNSTEVKVVSNSHSSSKTTDYVLTNLKPFTPYKIWVKAYTSRHEGDSSRTLDIRTDVQGPSAPYIVNLTCQSLDSLFLQWDRPQTYYNQIDSYYVYYRSENAWEFTEMPVAVSHDKFDQETYIHNLTANTMYEVKVRAATRSIIEHTKLLKGQFSEPRKVLLQSFSVSSYTDSSISAGMIAGVVCASFALLLAIISFILWRKYFQAAYYYLDDPPANRASPQLSETFDDTEYASIPVTHWAKHVANLHADGDIGFSREYESIQQATDLDLSSEHSQMLENKNKNRYVNIVAYDHTRVILKPAPGQKKTPDYINANYIDGYNKSRAYIGTQGPLPSTFEDYWRMIWEQRVYIIIMITNLVERGRRKCDMYWPKEGSETYGVIQVKLVQEVVMATYTVRTFTIRNLKVKKKHGAERTVYQYHYTNWPDHGVPEHPLPVLSFVRKSSAAHPPNSGPIIVHCSAGVGRTGTYIVLDAMLKQIRHRQSVNVYGFLKHIRQQRNYLVQTEEQYIFIHDALLEAIESGETEVPCSQLPRYIQNLQTAEGGDANNGEKGFWPLLERQFKLVTAFKAKDFNVVSALKPCNKGKNRSLNLIPIESYRVHITPKPGTDGSDYINATFMPGFQKLREFIITQHPLHETIADFWQMVWDHNSQTVVMLSLVDEKEFPQFWPDKDEESDYGNFKVKMSEETFQASFVTRDFIIQSTQDDYELTCRVIQCPGWPECCSPLSSVFDLVHVVQEWHLEYQNGPMIVMDRCGGTEAATFCCLTTLFKQMEYEEAADVYMHAKLYHMRRPGIWRTQDDYLFLYRALESIVAVMQPVNADTSFSSQVTITNGHVNSNGHAVKIDASLKGESLA